MHSGFWHRVYRSARATEVALAIGAMVYYFLALIGTRLAAWPFSPWGAERILPVLLMVMALAILTWAVAQSARRLAGPTKA